MEDGNREINRPEISAGRESWGLGGENPWQTHSNRVAYENAWIRVVENQVTNPQGGRGIYGVVHFRNRAVGVVALDADNGIWLVGQYRYALGCFEWEIPEGGAPAGEALEVCARRELEEETGIRAASLEPLLMGMELSNSVTDELAYVFLARGLTFHQSAPEATEKLTVRRVTLEEAFEMLDRGELRDSMTVAGLLKLRVEILLGRISLKRD